MRYPKLFFLVLTFLAAYAMFAFSERLPFREEMFSLGYLGVFLSGIFYSYGFTAAPATALLLVLAQGRNIILAALIGGFGSLLADLTLFRFIRSTFADELEQLSREKIVRAFMNVLPPSFRRSFLRILGFVIIASPLPDEIGTALLASGTRMSEKMFSLLSFMLNTAGILAILWVAGR